MESEGPNSTRDTEKQLPSPATKTSPTASSAKEETTSGLRATTGAQPSGGPPLAPPPQPTPTSEPKKSGSSWGPGLTVAVTTAGFVLLASIVGFCIYPLGYPTRAYVALAATATGLVLAGLLFLIVWIPAASKYFKPDLRTELYSVRAAYVCVIAGLIMFGIVAIGVVLAQVMRTVGH